MTTYSLFLFLLGFAFLSVNLNGQDNKTTVDNEDLEKFVIIITTDDHGFQMECWEGCNWKKLSYSDYTIVEGKVNYSKAIVDVRGVGSASSLANTQIGQNSLPESKFAFSVQQTEEGVYLQGIKGTAWEKLSYRCINADSNCRQAIDELGMFELDPLIDH